MLKFRIKILENILNAPNPTFVANAMNEILEEISANDVLNNFFLQYIKSVRTDIFFQMRLRHSRREFNNLAEALKIIQIGINLEKQ